MTGDPACREKAESLLKAWAECIEPDGYFFFSRKPNAPHYIYDKMVGGLTDMVLFCDSKLAADSLAQITGWAVKNLDRTNDYAFSGTEWYTLSENLYRAHRATGDARYLKFARVWHYTEYWDLFARKRDLFGDRGNGRRNRRGDAEFTRNRPPRCRQTCRTGHVAPRARRRRSHAEQ